VASPLAAALDVIARDQQKSRLASLTEQ
jgi:hypothetical protein